MINNTDTAELEGVSTTQALLGFGADDVGNAESVMHLYGDYILHTPQAGWLVWCGTHWTAHGASAQVRTWIIDTLKQRGIAAFASATQDKSYSGIIKKSKLSTSNINNAITELRAMVDASLLDFDKEEHLLNCPNGTIDLRTGELLEHDPAHRLTHCINAEYHPETNYDDWLEWVVETVGTEEMADYMQRAMGYSLTADTSAECLFYLHGKPRAGKGTFIEAFKALVGDLGRTTSISTLTDPTKQGFELAPLRNARSVFCAESERRNALNVSSIKRMTGGNELSCSFKGRDGFQYRPMFKVWIESNWQVNGDVEDDAFWARVKVIPFVQSFLGNPDPTIKQRMKSPENLVKILAWAVDGAIEWYARGLQEPSTVKNAVNQHRSDLDYIGRFIDEVCDTSDSSAFCSKKLLRHIYEMWCKDQGVKVASGKTFAKYLERKGYRTGDVKKRCNHTGASANPVYVYMGIRPTQ